MKMISLAALFLGSALVAQTPAAKPAPALTIALSFERAVANLAGEVVPLADAMPEQKFAFAPTQGEFKGVKTFSQQALHIASANFAMAAAILQEKPPVDLGGDNGPEGLKTKTEVVKYLKDSYVYLQKAMGSLTEANLIATVKSPWGKNRISRVGLANMAIGHGFNHYGQMVVYLRMNGLIPPASR